MTAKLDIQKHERFALFIDGTNFYRSLRELDIAVDYGRLLSLFKNKGQLVRALYYTALQENVEFSSIRPLIDWLDYNGYSIVSKPTREYVDKETGRRRLKGDMDLELAIDALELSEKLDHIVLFSGDSDFRCLVEAIQRKGVRVTVISTVKTSPAMAADDLRRQADSFVDIVDLRDHIEREGGGNYADDAYDDEDDEYEIVD